MKYNLYRSIFIESPIKHLCLDPDGNRSEKDDKIRTYHGKSSEYREIVSIVASLCTLSTHTHPATHACVCVHVDKCVTNQKQKIETKQKQMEKITTLTCVDVNCLVAWNVCRKPHRKMCLQDFCGCARESTNCMILWNVFGNICKCIHISVAFYDENQTDSRRYRYALLRTLWRCFILVRVSLFVSFLCPPLFVPCASFAFAN